MMADFFKFKTKYALGFQSITSNQGELGMGSQDRSVTGEEWSGNSR